jgi:hypothetical protein
LQTIGPNEFYYDFIGEEFAACSELRLASEQPVHLGKRDAELLSFGEDVVPPDKFAVKMQSQILDFFRLGKLNVIYMNWGTGFSACGEGDMSRLSAIGFLAPRFKPFLIC